MFKTERSPLPTQMTVSFPALRFFDKPANVAGNRSFEEEAQHRFHRARNQGSVGGAACQLIGLLMIASAPFAFMGGMLGIPVAAGLFAGGASTAAIGSSASSNKRTASMTELNTWLKINNY